MQDATQPATIAPTQTAASSPSDALPSLSPSHSYSLSMDVTGVDFSYDGHSLIVVRARQCVDVWDALTYWWPEISIILAMLSLLIIGVRVSKRPNALGEPHCRRCGYMLRNLQETRCPECGYEKATERPRYGRRRAWRIATLVGIALAYVIVSRLGQLHPLRPVMFGWFHWPTDHLTSRARTSMLWLNACRITCSSVSILRLEDGSERVLNPTLVGALGGPLHLEGGAVMLFQSNDALTLIDAETGELIRRFRADEDHGYHHRSTRIVRTATPTDGDRSSVWILLNTGRVRRWNLNTNESLEVLAMDGWTGDRFLPTLTDGGRVAIHDPLRATPTIRLLDEPAELLTFAPEMLSGSWPALAPDGRFIATTPNVQGVTALEIRSRVGGSLIHRIEALSKPDWLGVPLFLPDGRFIVVSRSHTTLDLLVADVESGTWAGRLETVTRPNAIWTFASPRRPSVFGRAGFTGASIDIEVFDLDSLNPSYRP